MARHFFGSIRPSRRGVDTAHLAFEVLEDRSLLAVGAVGVFERVGGSLTAEVNAYAAVGGAGDHSVSKSDNDEQNLVHLSAAAQIGDEGGNFAFANSEATALIPTPVGGDISAPFVTSASSSNIHAQNYAVAGTFKQSSGQAQGDFEYHADPDSSGNLVMHIHLYIAAYGGSVATENARVTPNTTVSASGDGFGMFSGGPVNLHEDFTVPIQDGSIVSLAAATHSAIEGRSPFEGEFASSIWNGSSASWAYVTVEGQDVSPGDFDFDGDVDGDDYEIWNEGSPQADADLDGDVDAADYHIWSANVDGILVSTETDESDGNYSFGDLSLREALLLAADTNHPGQEIIAFAAGIDEILLTGGPLSIASANDVLILGPGGSELTVNAQGNSGVFTIADGANVNLSGFTITGGEVPVLGGGINSDGNLTLMRMTITGNCSGRYGGGIASVGPSANLIVSNSIIAGNTAVDGGGGIYQVRGTIDVLDSEISDNSTTSTTVGIGGGLRIYNATTVAIENTAIEENIARLGGAIYFEVTSGYTSNMTVYNSTFAENTADLQGGAFWLKFNGNANAEIVNTTISANTAADRGGGVHIASPGSGDGIQFTNVTIADNVLTGGSLGGGIYISGNRSKTRLFNTIVANNLYGSSANNIYGLASTNSGYNLIGPGGAGGMSNGVNGNIVLTTGQSAGLVPLGNYGGATRTHALLSTSPAIDAGDDAKAIAFGLLYDQRGENHERILDSDDDSEEQVDIGAFESAFEVMYV